MLNTGSLSHRLNFKSLLTFLIILYVLLHLLTLGRHPFVHSDEAWLAVLTRAMIVEKNPAAVEEVFRFTPRYPHAVKTLYHIIQAPFLAVSWSAYSSRLPSLLAGFYLLLITTYLARLYMSDQQIAYLPAVLTGIDPQFWYISHLGRQEMILTALFVTSWYFKKSGRKAGISAIPLMCAVFIHPNAFVIAVPVVSLYFLDLLFSAKGCRRRAAAELLYLVILLGTAGAAAVGASFLMDREFLRHYLAFGDTVGTGDSIMIKVLGIPRFFSKMWHRNAGTYYLADVRPMFLAGIFGAAAAAGLSFRRLRFRQRDLERKHDSLELLAVLFALVAGIAAVGKYSPPSLTFLMPAIYLIFGFGISYLHEHNADGKGLAWKTLSLVVALVLITVTSRDMIESFRRPSYKSYIDFIQANIDGGGRVLANLNTAFAFEYDRMLIWRDLEQLEHPDDSGTNGFAGMIDEYSIKWIVYSSELEYIYFNRPVWNAVYGNPAWYPDLMSVLEERGTSAAEGAFPGYSNRIIPLENARDWKSQIYRID